MSTVAIANKEGVDAANQEERKSMANELRKIADEVEAGGCTGFAAVAMDTTCDNKACDEKHTTVLTWVPDGTTDKELLRIVGGLGVAEWNLLRDLNNSHALAELKRRALLAEAQQSDKH